MSGMEGIEISRSDDYGFHEYYSDKTISSFYRIQFFFKAKKEKTRLTFVKVHKSGFYTKPPKKSDIIIIFE
jgi:hypothetical protein